jgi:hypothetical protein
MCVSASVNMSEPSADSIFKGTVSRDLEKAVIFYLECVCMPVIKCESPVLLITALLYFKKAVSQDQKRILIYIWVVCIQTNMTLIMLHNAVQAHYSMSDSFMYLKNPFSHMNSCCAKVMGFAF